MKQENGAGKYVEYVGNMVYANSIKRMPALPQFLHVQGTMEFVIKALGGVVHQQQYQNMEFHIIHNSGHGIKRIERMNSTESIHHEELKGYDNLTKEQQKEFKGIFKKYMLSKGIDARKDIDIKSVEMHGRKFKISTIQWGLNGYAILNPVNQTWY